jgi:ubiquinone/menaquinone biosynthesis C-methylase UbiE
MTRRSRGPRQDVRVPNRRAQPAACGRFEQASFPLEMTDPPLTVSDSEAKRVVTANMDVQESYNHWSATYDTDENLTRDLDQLVTRETLADSRWQSILEIGCGTGKNTALLAQIGDRVCALDFSEGMIARAKDKLRSANVIFALADITKQWPCADGSVDLVACHLVLEHIEELPSVFEEAYRSLVKGGEFLVCELHPFWQYQGKKARFQTNQGKTEIRAFVHHLSDFLAAAEESGLALKVCREWWHDEDQGQPPRLVSFVFEK